MAGTIERISRTDPETGVKILQLTSFPLIHYHQYIYGQWIAPDAKSLLLFGYREPRRDSPIDVWRVSSDGSGLEKLVEGGSWSAVSPDSTTAYVGGGSAIMRAPMAGGGNAEPLVRLLDYGGVMVNAVSPDGRWLFCHAGPKSGGVHVLRVEVATGKVDVIHRPGRLMHLQIHGTNGLLANMQPEAREIGIWTCSFNGDDVRKLPFARSTNHFASLGNTGRVITTVHGGGCAIEVATPGEPKVDIVAQGVGFWHPTSDASGEWAVADTNWPDVGMFLVHVPSGRHRKLCTTGASGGHPQWTHAHPRLAPDASYVVFDSDRTGICHVYLAFVPEEMKAALRKG